MDYKEMLGYAKEILNLRKEYYLCGSIPLILAGLIPERDVGDIDFIVKKEDYIHLRGVSKHPNYIVENLQQGYTCYEKSNDRYGYYYNIFVHEDSQKLKLGETKEGIRCQYPSQIIEWKEKFGRRKDLIDLRALKSD